MVHHCMCTHRVGASFRGRGRRELHEVLRHVIVQIHHLPVVTTWVSPLALCREPARTHLGRASRPVTNPRPLSLPVSDGLWLCASLKNLSHGQRIGPGGERPWWCCANATAESLIVSGGPTYHTSGVPALRLGSHRWDAGPTNRLRGRIAWKCRAWRLYGFTHRHPAWLP